MRFFVPNATRAKNAEIWDALSGAGRRAISSVTYEHDGSRFVVTVGLERQEYRRRTGPRGGYVKNAGHVGWAVSTGSRGC
jgi:hypothetical protein